MLELTCNCTAHNLQSFLTQNTNHFLLAVTKPVYFPIPSETAFNPDISHETNKQKNPYTLNSVFFLHIPRKIAPSFKNIAIDILIPVRGSSEQKWKVENISRT